MHYDFTRICFQIPSLLRDAVWSFGSFWYLNGCGLIAKSKDWTYELDAFGVTELSPSLQLMQSLISLLFEDVVLSNCLADVLW